MSNSFGIHRASRGKRLIGLVSVLALLTATLPALRAQDKPREMPNAAVAPPKSPAATTANAPVSNDPVEVAIRKAVAFLYSQQKNGNWEQNQRRQGDGAPDVNGAQWGGLTAIATYGLLASGENPQNPKLKPAIEWLIKNEIIGTYAMGMKLQMYTYIENLTAEQKAALRNDATLLMNSIKVVGAKPADEMYGMYHYYLDPTKGAYDHSTSNYGVLGMWAAAQKNLEVPTEFWRVVDAAWRRNQHKEGSWSYHKKADEGHDASVSLTAAGVATLFITQDYIMQSQQQERGWDCRGNIQDENIERGLKWLSDNYKSVFTNRWKMYALYNVERVGTASGYKYFGKVDWYRDGAAHLLKTQKENGSWESDGGVIPSTVWGILFLVKGRAPVMFNKLEYALAPAGGGNSAGAAPANWNQRPRDVANLARWTSKMLEKDLNWQIVNMQGGVDDLHDAPILYISGNQVLNFSKEDKEKLKLYVEQGGMILGHADCNEAKFSTSFMRLGHELFKGLEFRELPSDHPIYTVHFNRKNWTTRVQTSLKGLSNGARELMVLIPSGDPARFWQVQNFAAPHTEALAQMAANIYLYAADKQTLKDRYKGAGFIVKRNDKIKPAAGVNVARLEYAGIWNPEPGGWRRLDDLMHNAHAVDVDAQTVKLGEGKLKADTYKLAHLTGTARFTLNPAQQKELKEYVENGGTLVIDAAGGSTEFKESAEAQLQAIFGAKDISPLKTDHPVYSAGGQKVDKVAYRSFARRTLVSNMTSPRLKGVEVKGRTAIFYSPEDLSVGLVGMPVEGIYGYEPDDATRLMRNIVAMAMGGKLPEPPQPANNPETQKDAKPPAEKKEMDKKEPEKSKPTEKKGDEKGEKARPDEKKVEAEKRPKLKDR
jgi:hypothetical protein